MSYKMEDISPIYILVLKYKMKIEDIPRGWLNVEYAIKRFTSGEHKIRKMPGYIKLTHKYKVCPLKDVVKNAKRKT